MWTFALSIALFYVGGDLQLPAVSSFVNSAAVLILAATLGGWIDRTPRLRGTVNTVIVIII